MTKPKQNDKLVGIEELRRLCRCYVDFFEDENFNEDRLSKFAHYIFECALESVYGEEVWDYINEAWID